jgi:hypothetical protein
MTYHRTILLLAALLIIAGSPVLAVANYMGGSPSMSALVSGTNEFAPGEDAVITVIVQNSGVNSMKTDWVGGKSTVPVTTRPDLSRDNYDNNYGAWQGSGNIVWDDIPTTAKMVTVGLGAGTAPVVIRQDPQNVGDIKSPGSVMVSIPVKITADATNGEYQLPLSITYTYLETADNIATDVLEYKYQKKTVVLPLTIRIIPQVKIDVVNVTSETLSVGTGGHVTLTIRNLGYEDGKKATVRLVRNGNSPIIPTDSSVFVGDFPRGGEITCRYKVSISTDAGEQTYPVDVVVTYENRDGDVVTSAPDTVGIPVSGKVTFAVDTVSAAVKKGGDQIIEVRYENTGRMPVYGAQARISVVKPFFSSDNTAYLGNLEPGESATARYAIGADSDAEVKDYTLDSEVRYRDALDNSQVSDSLKVPVRIEDEETSVVLQLLPFLLLVLVVCGAGYYVFVMRKKK